MISLKVFLVLFTVQPSFQINNYDTSTLKLVHVVFRHGARTPDSFCSGFGVDNSTYWPDGFGALTMKGKQQEYNIGVSLRERYNTWLGDVYYPEVLSARSTDVARAKVSLLLALAGLFPPNYNQTWNWEINWQPIPISFTPQATDTLMGYVRYNCPNFIKELNRVFNTAEVQKMLTALQPTFNFINKRTKYGFPDPYMNMMFLSGCISSWREFNKTVPAWMNLIHSAIENPAIRNYELFTSTPLLQKLAGGQLLKKILSDSDAKINGTNPTKIFLYSGHEYNVGYTLRALKAFVAHVPPYASYVILELHTINQVDGFKIFYQKYDRADPVPVVVPGCQEFCPLSQMKSLLADNLPDASVNCWT